MSYLWNKLKKVERRNGWLTRSMVKAGGEENDDERFGQNKLKQIIMKKLNNQDNYRYDFQNNLSGSGGKSQGLNRGVDCGWHCGSLRCVALPAAYEPIMPPAERKRERGGGWGGGALLARNTKHFLRDQFWLCHSVKFSLLPFIWRGKRFPEKYTESKVLHCWQWMVRRLIWGCWTSLSWSLVNMPFRSWDPDPNPNPSPSQL